MMALDSTAVVAVTETAASAAIDPFPLLSEADPLFDIDQMFLEVFHPATTQKRVRFAAENEPITSSAPLDLVHGCEQELWYTARDLYRFRSEARRMGRQLRSDAELAAFGNKYNANLAANQTQQKPRLAQDEATRGLEHRSCLERQRRKFLTNRHILKYSNNNNNNNKRSKVWTPEQLGKLARRSTAWAVRLAAEEGARDFLRAYYPDDEALLSLSPSNNEQETLGQEEACVVNSLKRLMEEHPDNNDCLWGDRSRHQDSDCVFPKRRRSVSPILGG